MLGVRGSKKVTPAKKGEDQDTIVIFPEFVVENVEDLMIRGSGFYAFWDEETQMWSRDPFLFIRRVDDMLTDMARDCHPSENVIVQYLKNFSNKKWKEFCSYCASMPDNYVELDTKLTFASQEVKKNDYVSRRLPYDLKSGSIDAYEEIISTIYDPIERRKIEWAIGAIISGESIDIQKFLVLYGPGGSGKSTILNIIELLFPGYFASFKAADLGKSGSSFALESFKNNPLLAIDHDADLSRIEDNTVLNKIIAHDRLPVNEKFKSVYEMRFNTFLFIGTNRPVKITEAKSGIIRRLIDVKPTGRLVPFGKFNTLMAQVKFELGAIAKHCWELYSELGPDAYNAYVPTEMIGATNDFYNFIEYCYDVFIADNGTTLKQAWELYKKYNEEADVKFPLSMRAFKEELKNYFDEYYDRRKDGGKTKRNVYYGFRKDKFGYVSPSISGDAQTPDITLQLESETSLFDKLYSDSPAQYATADGIPFMKWDDVTTKLKDIQTKELHYVRLPENHVVIDFDLKNEDGEKSLTRNLMAASKWPKTYAELSKSGAGVHLHYIYEGDISKLDNKYADDIEIKTFTGNSALRRKLTRCNTTSIATLNTGLPEKKGGTSVGLFETLHNEKALRTIIKRNLNKEIHPGTKPSIDFIFKVLTEAYESGMHYDVTDLRQAIMTFANSSTNHALYCIKLVNNMPFHSDEPTESEVPVNPDELIFYDVEVYPNLFIVCWKTHTSTMVKMINPTPVEIEELIRHNLVGFNCRRYDNHILYARLLGYSNEQLYKLSQKIINNSSNAMFREAYNLSYTDIYDFSSKKQSLKKWQVELGIFHLEMGIPWDEPVPENMWDKVANYCCNDVISTEAVFYHLQGDWNARKILADLSGLTVNDTTQRHAAKIIFGNDKNPQEKFEYTDLSEMFPGYEFKGGVSTYLGEEVGEGGYVYAEPGIYEHVCEFDIASMHPTSIDELNLFGPYTDRFRDLKAARLAIKHNDVDAASEMLGGILKPYLEDKETLPDLSYALKIVINIIYGLTSAKFDNPFRDVRNVDNIVAKRGALFMVELKQKLQEAGVQVIHIKTDSIKISNPSEDIVGFIKDFGMKFGYLFEDEPIYEKFCLVNDAVYIARYETGKWTATGAQFAEPYVFKTLFSKEPVEFTDFVQIKQVTSPSVIYLDMNESLGEDEHEYHFVGKAGSFVPVKDGTGGGLMMRMKDDKYYYVTGTKGYRWLESEMIRELDKTDCVDISYFDKLADKAIETISKFGDFKDFVKEN